MTLAPSPPAKHATALGVLCGAGSALFWSFGFVAARHGVLVGLSPLVLSPHRVCWRRRVFVLVFWLRPRPPRRPRRIVPAGAVAAPVRLVRPHIIPLHGGQRIARSRRCRLAGTHFC